MTTWRLCLRPTSPWATPWHADSLFGALAWRCAEAFGERALLDWISAFTSGQPPFLLSDALPGDCFPAPLAPHYRRQDGRKLKTPVWVNAADFRKMLSDPSFREAASSLTGGEKDKSVDRLQASLSRTTDHANPDEGGALFEVEQRIFHPDTKNADAFHSLYIRAETHQTLQALLGLLSVTGFGKKSSTGLGAFEVEGEPDECPWLDAVEGANGFVSLSHFVPAATDPIDGAWRTNVTYPKYHGSAVQHPFKGRLVQLAPGSWFRTAGTPRSWYGRAVPAGCEEYSSAIQYGFALAVPALLGAEEV